MQEDLNGSHAGPAWPTLTVTHKDPLLLHPKVFLETEVHVVKCYFALSMKTFYKY